MTGFASRFLPYALAFFSSLCIMVLELVASRLVARHVGGSLIVWTSVIGIMLGGICLGNVLGGRLADRIDPRRAVGPLFALGAFLTLSCLWMNSVVGLFPGLDSLPWDLRTVLIVSLDFLIPGTVLGMISPVVAKMAVEQSKRSGSAIGDIYMLGAIGSIVGTFLAGFWLIYLAPTSSIVTLIAAAYALMAVLLLPWRPHGIVGLLATFALGIGGVLTAFEQRGALPGIPLSSIQPGPLNMIAQALCLGGHLFVVVLAAMSLPRLKTESPASEISGEPERKPTRKDPQEAGKVTLADLAFLSFLISLAFMTLEMVSGRLVQRHLGSSVYGWTSVIGVLLGGLSLGNYLGGKLADFVKNEKQASWLFLAASVMTALVLMTEAPPSWLVRNPIGYLFKQEPAEPLAGGEGAFLHQAIGMSYAWVPLDPHDSWDPTRWDWGAGWTRVHASWGFRVFFWTFVVFFIPAITMGTVSPIVAKLAVDRLRQSKRTGTAIGQVYAWGMVGSILGTFLTGFLLIDVLGTKGVLLALAAVLAMASFTLGGVWHALWAGIPLGLCVIAFLPVPFLEKQGLLWGVREAKGDPNTTEQGDLAYSDESNYYYIKITNYEENGRQNRTLVLDNLIHGYFIKDHPEQLDYDYEHVYALVAKRLLEARAKAGTTTTLDPTAPPNTPLSVLFLGGGSYTFPRYLQRTYPGTTSDVAEIDPAVTRANHAATFLPPPLPTGETGDGRGIHTVWGDARQFIEKRHRGPKKYDIVFGDAFNDFSVPWHLTTKQFNDMLENMLTEDGIFMINIIDIYLSDKQAQADAGQSGLPNAPEDAVALARRRGGFLSSWCKTARLTFPNIYVFGTNSGYAIDEDTGELIHKPPGKGLRETFVIVASKKPLDVARLELKELGGRYADPNFPQEIKVFEPYGPEHVEALEVRSQGITLTDDYAPVENLLAPVAETRGDSD